MGIKSRPRHDSFTDSFPSQKLWDPIATLEIINPARGNITCVGYAPSCGRRCRNPINYGNRESAYELLEALSYIDTSTTNISGKLRQLAQFTLCVRYHQDQDERMVKVWSKQIRQQQRMGIGEEPLLHARQKTKSADFFEAFEQKLREEQEWMKRLQERVECLEKENQRLKYEAEKRREYSDEEKQQKKRNEETQRKKDEETQRRKDEEKRQQEKNEEEELQKKQEEEKQKKSEEQNKRRKEEEAKAKEAREREERNERVRRRAEEMRKMRAQKVKEQADKERQEWHQAWLRYVSQWEQIKKNGTKGTSEKLRETIPWPVKSGNYKDVSEAAIEEFFQKALPQDADSALTLAYMKAECLKWHTDRIPRMFGTIEDETLTRLFNTVAQVVVRLRVEKARK
ncbi:hypothetical protein DM02DRAFT_672846 [Periconia macrospinosa]|uniref:Uncharacterized protein n=1 Tax=Periconia macrospinosa TaxID=97972 RepID=A0A2V1DPS8_9PLEO|nr:hypothetical protein DM02DRAFT_672846 [Periconia macrospinosa]